MLAKKEVEPELQSETTYMLDVVPAVMSSVPVSPDSSISWLEAVQKVIAVQDTLSCLAPQDARELEAAVNDLLAAGWPCCMHANS